MPDPLHYRHFAPPEDPPPPPKPPPPRWRNDYPDRFPPKSHDAPCCLATMDQYGRICIGFCSPECIRRPENWRAERARRRAEREQQAE